jgi:hypothetical protein
MGKRRKGSDSGGAGSLFIAGAVTSVFGVTVICKPDSFLFVSESEGKSVHAFFAYGPAANTGWGVLFVLIGSFLLYLSWLIIRS